MHFAPDEFTALSLYLELGLLVRSGEEAGKEIELGVRNWRERKEENEERTLWERGRERGGREE